MTTTSAIKLTEVQEAVIKWIANPELYPLETETTDWGKEQAKPEYRTAFFELCGMDLCFYNTDKEGHPWDVTDEGYLMQVEMGLHPYHYSN